MHVDPTLAHDPPDAELVGWSALAAQFRALALAYPRSSGFFAVFGALTLFLGGATGWIDPVKAERWNARIGGVVRIGRRVGLVFQGAGPLVRQVWTGQLAFPEQHRSSYRDQGGSPCPCCGQWVSESAALANGPGSERTPPPVG